MKEKLKNKFNIPLTFLDTYDVFEVIVPESKFYPYIKMVYAPVHISDGNSGRMFGNFMPKREYVLLLKKIMEYKPVYITYPFPDLEVMREYIDYGVMNWMVSKWDDYYFKLKAKYPDLKISRSIVGNAYNTEMDERFDQIVCPYHKTLDKEWLENNKKYNLTIIPNQTCKPTCQNLDNHLYWICKTNTVLHPQVPETRCPDFPRFFFLPQKNLEMIIDYIADIKVLDRALDCSYYKCFLDHYINGKDFPINVFNPQLRSIYRDCQKVINKWLESDLTTGNCKYECVTCNKKCY